MIVLRSARDPHRGRFGKSHHGVQATKLHEACMLFEPKRPCNHANKSRPVNRNVCEPHKSSPDKLTSFAATRNDEISNGFDESVLPAVN